MSIRPDISEQASRIDAYRIASKDVVRLCYAGEVVKKRSSKVLRSRTTIQVGAEIFGDSSIESDLESINLMIQSLQEVGLKDITLSLGHAGFTELILSLFKDLDDSKFSQLEEALIKKSKSDIANIISSDNKNLPLIMDLCDMYGEEEIIEEAKNTYKDLGNKAISYLDHLNKIVKALNFDQSVKIHIDIGEVQGFKYHNGIKLDQLREGSKQLTKIGTTGRGIGTAYEDRVGRRSIRVTDLYDENKLKEKLQESLEFYNSIFKHSFNAEGIDLNELFEKNLKQGEKLKPYIGSVIEEIRDLQEADKKILFEGAQGALLDVSLGTYPYVTSSNSSVGGIASGIGISPTNIDYSLGIAKAYTTRVGEGPFPTELFDDIGTFLAEKGGEVGATTGRPRRCGWLDAFLLSHTVKLNGIDGLCITKIDVLDGLETIKVCTDYSSNISKGEILETLALEDVEPIYTELKGWEEPTAGKQSFEELNDRAKEFILNIEDLCKVPVIMISTGPKREDTIIRKYPL